MNDRERFDAIMHYRPADRGIIQDFSYWDETVMAWHEYGLPREVNRANAGDFFGLDRLWDSVGANVLLCPPFGTEVISDDGKFQVIRMGDGTVVRKQKLLGSIPQHLSHALTDRNSWERHFKWRLDPDNGGRFDADFDQRLAAAADERRNYPLATGCGSIFGQLHNWMGLEAVS